MPDANLPAYAPRLDAYHEAFAPELEAMIRRLPIREGDRVLEAACGDGTYSPWLARRAGASGRVVAFDVLPAYLRKAGERIARSGEDGRAHLVAASIDRPPFAPGSFDAAWCAQSLFSLPEPLTAVRQVARLVRPGGLVAFLEDDTLHQVLLPWPVEVELAVRNAQWRKLRDQAAHPSKFYVGRRLVGLFLRAGLVDVRVDTTASDRVAPLDDAARRFLESYLADLADRVGPDLAPGDRAAFDCLVDPGSPDALIRQPDLALTCIDHVVTGRVPG